MKKFSTRELVFLALLVSLNIVLTRIASIRIAIGGIEGIRIGFGAFPVILAGIMFGPLAGGIVGAVGDMIGYFINPIGPYMPHFTITSALVGIIPPLILKPVKNPISSLWQLIIAIGIGQLISSVILVPYFIQLLFKVSMENYFASANYRTNYSSSLICLLCTNNSQKTASSFSF
ncbi:hypothetical protein TKV_c21530 [Thermoanaerobacter kivui]|uniref:Uncharacterized protein n=1 Tax=Thermoanaerobacter kivui TaxID=2325 RepID=A0A097AU04_THEKI|nr:folate family ECF transporter S component [Thermoanaerobacter kivui]AIS53285.1 hypothetical protein TKV_c21530 [Thermoanaerobacter kivui]